MTTLRTYDITQVKLVLGSVPVEGLSAEGVVIEQENDDWAEVEDTAGNILRSRIPNRSALATVNVLPGSTASAQLNTLRALDKQTGRAPFTFYLRDFSSGTEVTAARAYFRRGVSVSMTSEAAAEAWEIVLVGPEFKIQPLPVS